MLDRLKKLHIGLLLTAASGLAMFMPIPLAVLAREWETARAFFYSGTILLILCAMIAIALTGRTEAKPVRSQLLTLLAAFLFLPAILAVPFFESQSEARFFDCYFEMLSSLTTTGATIFDAAALNEAQHFWRAVVGWLGGFLFWISAIAILAPLSLGGFEIISTDRTSGGFSQINTIAGSRERMIRFAAILFPIYLGLTLVLWFLLVVSGDTSFVAMCHAMAILATSGISPLSGLDEAGSGFGGEVFMALFLVFALSRRAFTREGLENRFAMLRGDAEIRLGLMIAIVVPCVIFLRHWVGAFEAQDANLLNESLQAFWGGFFTVMSFLTTTGFESAHWESARQWSGLETPGLILLGLAMIGGGVATTAGGVKLLRVYVLYRHAQRELERLVHPNSVGGSSRLDRNKRRQGAYLAWIFFMLFAFSVAAVMLALAYTGIGFEPAVILTISALSTTGPLAAIAGDIPIFYSTLPDPTKIILMLAMVLGRLETLANIRIIFVGSGNVE